MVGHRAGWEGVSKGTIMGIGSGGMNSADQLQWRIGKGIEFKEGH